jgi:hypothetical protein
MGEPLAGISPHMGVSQVPRLRAEMHFGVQARALPVGLHLDPGGVGSYLECSLRQRIESQYEKCMVQDGPMSE